MKVFSFKADPELVEKAKKKARSENRTLSNLIQFLLEKYIRNSDKKQD